MGKSSAKNRKQQSHVRENANTAKKIHADSNSASACPTVACNPAPQKFTCPVAHLCGACRHIDVAYTTQLKNKDAYIAKLFCDVTDPSAIRPILGMEEPFYYRNKVISPYAPERAWASASGKRAANADRNVHGNVHDAQSHKAGSASYQKSHENRPTSYQKSYKAHLTSRKEILCGMYAAGTHRIVQTDECLVENKQAQDIIRAIRSLMMRFGIAPYDEDKGTGFIRHVVVRVGHTSGEILVTIVTNGREFPASRSFCRELVKRCPAITSVVQNINERQTNVILGQQEKTLYGPGFILDRLCGLSFRISSQSFYQVNAVQTEVLYRQAISLAAFSGDEVVIDAYCGTGTIGLVAATCGAAEVIGVDSVEAAICDARKNARHNGIDNARFIVGDAGEFMRTCATDEFMRTCATDKRRIDVVFMDPPRAGASEKFLRAVTALAPARIVYISCNPTTQVRDLAFLCQHGFAVRAVQPIDMFPHTDHVECVALMSAKDT